MSEDKKLRVLPEPLLWKLRALYYEAALAQEKARDACRRRDEAVSEARTQITKDLPKGKVLLEIDMTTGVFVVGDMPSSESASIAPHIVEEGSDGNS